MQLAAELRERAKAEGFEPVGIAPAVPPPHYAEYLAWVKADMHGEMTYMERHAGLRSRPDQLLPGARSVLVVGLNYARAGISEAPPPYPSPGHSDAGGREGMLSRGRVSFTPSPTLPQGERGHVGRSPDRDDRLGGTSNSTATGRIAAYALGRDYHKVIRARLKRIGKWLEQQAPEAKWRVCVDSAPLLERDYAVLAGLGWYGKNTCIINTELGSLFLIGCVLTTLELQADEPAVGGCGTCRACLDACPTGAIVEPFKVDARRCISYLTIEKRGEIAPDLQPLMGDWVFGCDVCQDVCPFNHPRDNSPLRAVPTEDPDMQARVDPRPTLVDLATIGPDEFLARYAGTPIMRAGQEGMKRNAEIVLMQNTKRQ